MATSKEKQTSKPKLKARSKTNTKAKPSSTRVRSPQANSSQARNTKHNTRVRLAPEARKQMILDAAAQLISLEGVSAVSMERLGREANVSKSLVYAYFPSLTELLQVLLKREYRTLRGLQIEAAEKADSFENLIRQITSAYMTYMGQRGSILERLSAEPSVADHGDPTEYNRDTAVGYLAEILNRHYDFDIELAKAVVDISFGLPAAGGHYLLRHDLNRQTVEDITVTMIIGSVQAAADQHATARGKSGRKLKINLRKKFNLAT